jgi:two-component system chemotaxis response regulator CheY
MTNWSETGVLVGADRRVLVVDDSRAIRSMLRRLLGGLGFAVTEAGNGAEAIEALEAATPLFDLVLVDWNMPVMDGLAFLKAMRRERRFANIVVLMVSSESDPEKVARALMKGADDYVIKPLTADVLTAKLEMLDTWRPLTMTPAVAGGWTGAGE